MSRSDDSRADYALPAIDPLDAAVIAVGRIYEGLPDDELVEPAPFPPLMLEFPAPLYPPAEDA